MKTFTQFNEAKTSVTSDINPGNKLGVMNHYTPINNIVTNVRNLFCPVLGCVVCVGEDEVSVKLHSTKFVNKDEITKLLTQPVYNHLSLKDYILQQGLDLIKMINIGQYWVVYFCPRDIPQVNVVANPQVGCACPTCACHEQFEDEAEIYNFINEDSDDEEEVEDLTKKKVLELIKSKDKVKAAKQLELIIAQAMELPRDYYLASVKDKESGKESIAVRWKYTIKRPYNKTASKTVSLINIFDVGKDGVWVQYFVKDSYFTLPDEVKTLVENILELIGAEKTNDPAVYEISEADDKEEEKDKDTEEDNKKDDNEGKAEDKSEDKDDDSEDDDSRGDKSDDLLG